MSEVFELDPLRDRRWAGLADQHPAASVFHSDPWLQALHRTYGYRPVVYTTSPPCSPVLTNGIVVCGVQSWLTGRRLVSVPFADHCDPLVDSPSDRGALVLALRAAAQTRWGAVELRPRVMAIDGDELTPAASYVIHSMDLAPSLEDIFQRFHASTIQRKIRRAEREGLRYEEGQSGRFVEAFYRLLVITRRRHGLPPQPREWFSNLVECFGDKLTIAVVSKRDTPIAAVMTLRHQATITYKYGCSDAAFHRLGAMPFLFWQVIQRAKVAGATQFDLGRSDSDNPGLITFKERLGGVPAALRYVRLGSCRHEGAGASVRLPRLIAAGIPEPFFVIAGRMLYRHFA